MVRRELTKPLARFLKRYRIAIKAFVLMVLATCAYGWGGDGTALTAVDNVRETASSEVGDASHLIHAKFARSEQVYRGTDRGDAILILALVFSAIVAFNLWLAWHLHSICVPHRGSGDGRLQCRASRRTPEALRRRIGEA